MAAADRTRRPPARSAPAAEIRPGVVSVVVVNYRGADDTIECLRGLAGLDWPAERLQLVCVDNASGDGSVQRIRAAMPTVMVVESTTNSGFAGGCNLGVAHADGEYVAFLNNDARPDPQWVAAAVQVFERERSVASVASKVLDWDGRLVDYVGGSLTWFGMGYKPEVERPDSPEYDHPKDVLFATGAAMFVRAEVYREVGGFDERFFMFYEDVDLGWRLNLLGHRVRYEPRSVAFHRHHRTASKFGSFREQFLLERNAMLAMYKNFSDETLGRVLPAALALSVRRSIAASGADSGILDLARHPAGDERDMVEVPKAALAGAFAIDSFLDPLPDLIEERRTLQAARRRSDTDLMPLFRQSLEPAYAYPSYLAAYDALVAAFDIGGYFSRRRRVAVVTGEPLGRKLAGPAIRAYEMARVLSAEHEVQLLTLGTCTLSAAEVNCRSITGRDLRKVEAWCDILVFQGHLLSAFPWLNQSQKVLVADVYDPFHLEVLEQERDRHEDHRWRTLTESVDALNRQLRRADFVLCASAKQRDFWLGQLAALGRVNPDTYDEDETLGSLLAVVPFGISETPPERTRPALKGVVPGIGPDDTVLLWGGGIYNWFDPLTLIEAVNLVRENRPDLRLFFLGLAHPNPDVPEMRMAWAARELADRLGLTGTHVFFNDGWVDYDDRQNYLLDADIGVSCHLQHVETEFSFRTRILDYLWAGLPILATAGDSLGNLVELEGLGVAVPAEDVTALAEALSRLLEDDGFRDECSKRVADVAARMTWPTVLAPLGDFCRSPRRAPDLVGEHGPAALGAAAGFQEPAFRPTWRQDLRLAASYFRAGGPAEVGRRAYGRIRRRTRELRAGSDR
jgi:GT2 family glycosyltransferase/glycosyltransferase involved in cell wall biosynthesis